MEILKIIDHDLKEHIKGFTLKILIMFSFASFCICCGSFTISIED